MVLKFKMYVEEPDAPTIFEKWILTNKFPKSLMLSELDILSIIRMSRLRNRKLYDRILPWYGKIDQKFRLI